MLNEPKDTTRESTEYSSAFAFAFLFSSSAGDEKYGSSISSDVVPVASSRPSSKHISRSTSLNRGGGASSPSPQESRWYTSSATT